MAIKRKDDVARWISENIKSLPQLINVVKAANKITESKQTPARFEKTMRQIEATANRPSYGLARMTLGLILRRLYRLSKEKTFASFISRLEIGEEDGNRDSGTDS
jgi:hypothetical protein